MPRIGGDGSGSLTKAAIGCLTSKVSVEANGKLGRTCAQQQKQSSSCGVVSDGGREWESPETATVLKSRSPACS